MPYSDQLLIKYKLALVVGRNLKAFFVFKQGTSDSIA